MIEEWCSFSDVHGGELSRQKMGKEKLRFRYGNIEPVFAWGDRIRFKLIVFILGFNDILIKCRLKIGLHAFAHRLPKP